MLAWQGLGLGPGVIAAIATLGFDEPTPIQRECMLPAIRDRRDIIGAAQTVASSNKCMCGRPSCRGLEGECILHIWRVHELPMHAYSYLGEQLPRGLRWMGQAMSKA